MPEKAASSAAPRRLRLLTYNIHAGLAAEGLAHYWTGLWRHALPARDRAPNLASIAQTIRGYDLVAVQEADAGSLRTLQQNQMAFLAERAGYPHHGLAITRDLAPFARICLGWLAHQAPLRMASHRLPSRIPGRGAVELDVELAAAGGPVTVIIAHLSLTGAARERQLHFLAEALHGRRHAVLVGDLNCSALDLHEHKALRRLGLRAAADVPPTYPSWAPSRSLDHVLVTPDLRIARIEALAVPYSDHLPLSVEIEVAA
jgi:endonuclease/exonuclease/phosphatase family metal-dependent hydrolase